jgi:hypothetical protein
VTGRRARSFVLLAATSLTWASSAEAQRGGGAGGPGASARPEAAGPGSSGGTLDLRRHDFAALAVSAHPWSTMVAVTIALPDGSAADPQELPGSAWLLGHTVRDALAGPLFRLGAQVSVEVERSSTVFQLLAAPEAWAEAYEALVEGVFAASLDFASLEERRAELQSVFAFERGAPSREFQAELANLVGQGKGVWSREPRGTAESIQRITGPDLGALRRRIYRTQDAMVTIVGAIDAEPGVELFPGGGGDGGDIRFRRTSGGGAAWSRGSRERLVRNVTNGWIGAAFPARRDAPRTALEFVAGQLSEALNPVPRDPGLFGARVRVEEHPDGPVIVVEAAVLPEDQERWERRIAQTLEGLASRYRDPSFFSLHRRQFHNAMLLDQSAPEAEGRRIATDLLRQGRIRDLTGEISGLTADHIVRTIETLGDPRILVFGPNLGR